VNRTSRAAGHAKAETLGTCLLIKVKPQRKCQKQQKLTIMNLTRNYNASEAKLGFYCLERNYANVLRRQRQLELAAKKWRRRAK